MLSKILYWFYLLGTSQTRRSRNILRLFNDLYLSVEKISPFKLRLLCGADNQLLIIDNRTNESVGYFKIVNHGFRLLFIYNPNYLDNDQFIQSLHTIGTIWNPGRYEVNYSTQFYSPETGSVFVGERAEREMLKRFGKQQIKLVK